MKTNNVGIYILIGKQNESTHIEPVLEKLSTTQGVRHVGMNAYVRSLMELEYDPAQQNSQTLVASLRQQGYHASLVGM